jgi:hypothetical protein
MCVSIRAGRAVIKATNTRATTLYDVDFCERTQETPALIREKRFDEPDLEHVAEEIEDTWLATL